MKFWRGMTAVLLVACAVGGFQLQAQRLPGGARPTHYALTITPDLAKARFTGSETIELVLDAPSRSITLNAAEIEFVSVRGYAGTGGLIVGAVIDEHLPTGTPVPFDTTKLGVQPQTASITVDTAKEQATFTFADLLPAGPVTLLIDYTGILNDKLRGFYLSKTKSRSYGVTQFESTDARRAFPSFDEPALKATFNVTLVIDSGDTAFSNTKVLRDTPGPVAGKHTVAFATTPKMSTYLVAWLVGDFVCTQGKSDGVPIRACATPDKLGLTKFALDAAKWDLKYYDQYFGIKYPMAKLDLLAIPDFEAGAMENFGCITFRETEMLVDAKDGALETKKNVTQTVAHEISHQWFGDLVTPEWWDNIWLNEGFATWMETKAAEQQHPDWNYAQDEAMDLNRTLDEDAGRTTRPIRQQAETPQQIDELFDDIAYGKAGAVIGMVEHWIGEEVFRKGVQAYLAAHLYGNATAEDFWDAQTRVSGLPVDQVMRSFVEQPGVPEVALTTEGAAAPVTQRRFLLAGSAGAQNDAQRELWTTPLCFSGAGCSLLAAGQSTMTVPPESPSHPFLFANADDKGYYRAAYAPALLHTLVSHAESGLTPPERIGLLGNQWALLQGGQVTVGEFLDEVLAVKQDPSARVLESSLGKVSAIESRIATDEDADRLNAVVRRGFAPVYAALGGPQKHEPNDHAELREVLFEELGHANDPSVLAQAQQMTAQLLAGHKPADPTVIDAAVALATASGDAAMYDKLQRVSRSASDPDVQEAALRALTRFQTPILVIRTLEYAVSDEMRSQDSWILIALLLERRPTQELAWQFVQQHWDAIERKATENSGARIVEATAAFCTPAYRDQVATFFMEHPVESAERTLAKSLDSIDSCIQLRAAQEPALHQWLDAQASDAAAAK